VSSEQQIIVRGEAERQAPADVAALSVVVQVDAVDQAGAYERATDVAAAVDAVLENRSAALGPRQAAVVVVQPTTRWVDGEEQRTGWRAVRSAILDVTALDELSPLLAELVAAGAIVHGPAWRLRPEHPVAAEVRAAAAVDARGRATTYAEALGVRVGRVDWIVEPGLRPVKWGGQAEPGGGRLMAMAADGDEMAVAPATLTVTASVEVAFAIER
jgi:uncharacterized protein YggE